MNFDLTEDHIMMRKMVRDFAEEECWTWSRRT